MLLALNLAGAALLGLGLLVSFPVSLLAAASFLRAPRHLTATSQAAAESEAAPSIPLSTS